MNLSVIDKIKLQYNINKVLLLQSIKLRQLVNWKVIKKKKDSI